MGSVTRLAVARAVVPPSVAVVAVVTIPVAVGASTGWLDG